LRALIVVSKLDVVEIGLDDEGKSITSCVVTEAERTAAGKTEGPRLTPNQKTMLSIVRDTGLGGLRTEDWNDRAREADLGTNGRLICTIFAGRLAWPQAIAAAA
jgi:hypothetical protein